jgi:NAD(P)H dehydrogenase (quinone)
MNALLVYAHPNAASFNRAVLEAVVEGLQGARHVVRIRDLYQSSFDPVLSSTDLARIAAGDTPDDIQREQALVAWAHLLVFVYPVWWFGQPALLKGWFDRTFTHGFAFRYGPGGHQGLLGPRKALIVATLGGSLAEYQGKDWESLLVRPAAEGVLGYCGVELLEAHLLYEVPGSLDATRCAMLEQVREFAASL